jgi:hypothetical protein
MMMKTRNISLFTLAFTSLFLLVWGVAYAVDSSQQAKAYAHKIFPQLMQDCSNNIADYYYFSNADEAKTAYLGEPVAVYSLNSFDPQMSLTEQAKQVCWYAFPVIVNGEPVTDFKVTLVNGDWVWDFGGSLNPMLDQVAFENNVNPRDCRAVMLGQPGPIYIVANEDGKEVAVRNYKNPESLELTYEEAEDIKIKLDAKQILEKSITPEEDIVVGPADSSSSFKQNASVWQRVMNYFEYIARR